MNEQEMIQRQKIEKKRKNRYHISLYINSYLISRNRYSIIFKVWKQSR